MKKKVIAIVATALLLGCSIGFAAGTTLLGAKVTGIYTIEQNGKKIADAAIINGSAYVPVRTMSEASGTELTVKGRTIILEKPAAVTETNTTVAELVESPSNAQRVLTEEEKATYHKWIVSGEAAIVKYNEVITQTEAELAAEKDPVNIQGLKDFIADLKSRIVGAQATINDAKARLGE